MSDAAIGITPKLLYAEFLKTPFWAELRSQALERDGWKCKRCGRDHHLQVHHKVYRSPWTATLLDDLETLCRKCHKKEHKIQPDQNRNQKPRIGNQQKQPKQKRVKSKEKLFHPLSLLRMAMRTQNMDKRKSLVETIKRKLKKSGQLPITDPRSEHHFLLLQPDIFWRRTD